MLSLKGLTVSVAVLLGILFRTEGTIQVMSLLDDETVYTIQERPILTNIDTPSKGMLVLAKPPNACKPIVPAPPMPINHIFRVPNKNSTTGVSDDDTDFTWVLLVSWNTIEECSIATKADNALAAGYSVIIFEDPAPLVDPEPEALSPLWTPVVNSPAYEYGWTDASVYAYAIDPEDWRILKNNYTSDEYYLTFDEANSMTSWFTYFLLGVLIIGAVFFTLGLSYVLVQLTGLILIWIRESIVSRVQQMRRDRRRRLPASQLKKIPIQQWNSDMLQDICSICLETFEVIDRVRILPCSHVFHQVCIDPWLLKQRRKCPNCKRKIVFPDENRDSDSSSDDERTPLIRRGSSGRESATTSPQQPRFYPQGSIQTPRMSDELHHGADDSRIVVVGCTEDPAEIYNRHDQAPNNCCCTQSSGETSTESASGSGTNSANAVQPASGQPDLRGKVEQLCARMENVGRKIRKKVKANQASKLENESSSDMSTGIQPVLVSVTVEPNHMPEFDNDEEREGDNESQEEASGDNANNYCCTSSQNSEPSSSQHKPELEVKVVPDSLTPNPNGGAGSSSIVPDSNA